MCDQSSCLDLLLRLRELIEREGYSITTVKDMDFILNAFATYIKENALEEYTPEIGEQLVKYCQQDLHVCGSRVERAKVIVRKLNRLAIGLEGRDALWGSRATPIVLPDQLKELLSCYILWCKQIRNSENTIIYKQWICCKFLKNLADIGCETVTDINAETIQTAFLHLGSTEYWSKIGPFLKFLYNEGQVAYDYSKLICYRRKRVPYPTVYDQGEIAAIESSIDQSTPVGIRNFAIILMLSRYGIRSRDIAALTFENLDFCDNRIHFIQQKTGDLWEGIMLPEVKAALQNYISNARPKVKDCNSVFLTATIPYIPLDSYAINTMVVYAFQKAGINLGERRHGSRAFRSSIASNMINDRVSTEIVRKVLGHGTQYALKFYAKIDIESMRLCPLPVPEPSGKFAELLCWKDGDGHV